MKIKKQNISLTVDNQNVKFDNKSFCKHNKLLGNCSKRGLIVGSSGCGKTNVMLCLLLHPNGLRYENVYIYSKSLYQPKYEYLRNVIKPIKGMGYFEYNADNEIIHPNNAKVNSVFIFDDVVCTNQSVMRDYFSFGRHRNLDCFYLCQTYTKIPKQLIRDNTNFLVLFAQDNTNLKHIFDEHVGIDMNYHDFKNLCSLCWKEKYGFLVIDKDSEKNCGRYRKGFDSFILF